MNPYPITHPRVRGGFAPFASGWNAGLKGLGDAVDPYNNVASDSTGTVTLPMDVVNSLSNTVTNPLAAFSSLPSWVWVVGAVAIFGLVVIPQGPRR